MNELIGAREATKRETRKALLEAALVEFGRKGFDAPSLDAICARAGYTRGAFYVHFASRDELVTAAMEFAIGNFVEQLMGPESSGEEDVEATIVRFADFVLNTPPPAEQAEAMADESADEPGDGPPFHKFLEACARSETIRGGMTRALEIALDRLKTGAEFGQAKGRLRRDIAAEHTAGLLLLLALGVFSVREIGMNLDVDGLRAAALRIIQQP